MGPSPSMSSTVQFKDLNLARSYCFIEKKKKNPAWHPKDKLCLNGTTAPLCGKCRLLKFSLMFAEKSIFFKKGEKERKGNLL